MICREKMLASQRGLVSLANKVTFTIITILIVVIII